MSMIPWKNGVRLWILIRKRWCQLFGRQASDTLRNRINFGNYFVKRFHRRYTQIFVENVDFGTQNLPKTKH